MNQTNGAAPLPMQFHVAEVSPGIMGFVVTFGPLACQFQMTVADADRIVSQWRAKIDEVKSGIQVVRTTFVKPG